MSDPFYNESSFTPEKWNNLSEPRSVGSYNQTEQERRKFHLPKGVYLDESFARTPVEVIDILKDEKELKESIGGGGWYEFGWATARNPQHIWEIIYHMFRFMSFAAVVTSFIILFFLLDEVKEDYVEVILTLIFPFIVMWIAKYKAHTSENKNNIGFNRKTGMVSIPRKGEKPFIAPFHEFIPYFYPHHILQGVNYHLYLGHRTEEIGAVNPNAGKHEQEMYADWALIQHFMDVSKPLPDIPLFEPFRQLDPTTQNYDLKTGRPEHYWRDMDIKEGKRLHNESYKRLRAFPASDQSQWHEVPVEQYQWPAIQKS